MVIRRKLAVLAGLGMVSLALVGIGAGAQFTTQVTATQTIRTGTADVQIIQAITHDYSDVWIDMEVTDPHAVTLDVDNQPDHFAHWIYFEVQNKGSLPLHSVSLTLTGSGDPALFGELYARTEDNVTGWYQFGKLADLVGAAQPLHTGSYLLNPGQKAWYTLIVGTPEVPSYVSLSNAAQGESTTATLHVSALDGGEESPLPPAPDSPAPVPFAP